MTVIDNGLTDELLSRNRLEDMMETEYEGLKSCGVICVGINELKKVNDVQGREMGDKLLLAVAESVFSMQKEDVDSYRYSGDEFLLIAKNVDKEGIRKLVLDWQDAWHKECKEKGLNNTLAVGMSWDVDPESVRELVVLAEMEMYRNKKLIKEGIPMEYFVQSEISETYGLYGKGQFFKLVDYKVKNEKGDYCLVAMDIEHFKLFNKWMTRANGDAFLEAIANTLKTYEKEHNGIAAYMGGDNFAIFLPNQKVLLSLLEQNLVEIALEKGKNVGFLPAFGVYEVIDSKVSADEMYDLALDALGSSVGQFDSRMSYYDTEMTIQAEKELQLIMDAKEALKNEEFVIYLQPKVRMETGKIVGGEALVRWIHPEKGLVPPYQFIPVLEKNGFISGVDKYVWELACKTIRRWMDTGIHPVPISINVSRIDILSFNVVAYLNELMKKYDVPKEYLKVEITESAYTEQGNRIVGVIEELRHEGFTLMMDDFGSGYSSLNMLKQAMVDIIKLDMKFLDFEGADTEKGIGILKSVINMSNDINLPIVMEGVETKEQADFLQELGVRFAQGYLYYKPMPLAEFEDLIGDANNVDSRGIYKRNLDIKRINRKIRRIYEERKARYEAMKIGKIRGGFIRYRADESQELLDVTESVAAMYGCHSVAEFRKYVGNSFLGMIYPKDRERVQKEINAQIFASDWNMDYIEYRIKRRDGEIRYINDYGHLETGKDGEVPTFYVFLLDVTDKMEPQS